MSSNNIYKKNNLISKTTKQAEGSSQKTNSNCLSNTKNKQTINLVVSPSGNYDQAKDSIYLLESKQDRIGHKLNYNVTKFNSPVRVSDSKAAKLQGYTYYSQSDRKNSQQTEAAKNKKLSTPSYSTRKNSENCDSNDETKSVSSIGTKESALCQTPNAKKSNDFKVKYKTEICKFWDINKTCKFGDNVRIYFT
jgi:hypothetical protein